MIISILNLYFSLPLFILILLSLLLTSLPISSQGSDVDMNLVWDNNQDGEIERNKIVKISSEISDINKNNEKNKNKILLNKYPTTVLSKFEQNAFNSAKERQANRMKIGIKQK